MAEQNEKAFIALSTLLHNGKEIKPGATVKLGEADAAPMLAVGSVKEVETKKKDAPAA